MAEKGTLRPVNSYDVLAALRTKYGDYFTSAELQIGKKGRVDFLAIRPSFSNPEIHAFEVKVSRQDFVQDNKWQAYLPACKQLWFVTAAGIVKKGEIPQECGHLELSKTGSKLFLRKKAPVRKMTDYDTALLFRRIIHREYYGHDDINQSNPRRSRMEKMLEWTREREERDHLANKVALKVQRLIHKQQRDNDIVRAEMRGYDRLKIFLESQGIDLSNKNMGMIRNPENFLRNECPDIFGDSLQRELKSLKEAVRYISTAAKEFSSRTESQVAKAIEKLDSLREKDS